MTTTNDTQNATQIGERSAGNKEFSMNDYYVLSTDFHDTTRLALQHYIWQQALGFNIHPSIPELEPAASVADVACGTSLWLVDVGRQLGPSFNLHGFDINLNQAPPQQWLPENLKLHTWNLFDDVPQEFVGKFNLVHVRLITVVVKDNNPVKIMQNLCKLLKPGGYLQWDEVHVFGSFVVRAYPELDVPAMDAWCTWMSNPKGESRTTIVNDWKGRGVELLKDNGFETAQRYDLTDKFLERMELMRYNNDQLLMLSEQYARRVFVSGHAEGNRLLKTVEDAAKDTEKGAVMIMPPFCWVAKKAA